MSRSTLTLIKLVSEVLANPGLTPEYQHKKDIVNVLDGWTVPIAVVLEHRSRDPVTHEIVQRRYTGPDLIVESVDIGIDLLSSLSHALDDFSIKQVVTHPITNSPDEFEISSRTPQVVAENFGDVKELFKFVSSRRTFHRTLVLPTSFPFFVNRFTILRRPHLSNDTELEVLMQLFLYWRVVTSSPTVNREHHCSPQEWCSWIEGHKDKKVYGERSFSEMWKWWGEHVEAEISYLSQEIASHYFPRTNKTSTVHAEMADQFCSMVRDVGDFFDKVASGLGFRIARRPDTTYASSSNAVHASSSRFEAVARPQSGQGGRRHADARHTPPIVLDY